ncbi:MAG: hypothetical protein D6780_00075 [Candidatus Dadabacteria bacterium]|nr:MAG: hypothetical protein D6780_00075 [Candidatus Dadabacteria bacterium]
MYHFLPIVLMSRFKSLFARKEMVISIILIGVAISLFFLPEILSLGGGRSKKLPSARVRPAERVEKIAYKKKEAGGGLKSLYREVVVDKSAFKRRARAALSSEQGAAKDIWREIQFPVGPEITWSMIRSKRVKQTIGRAIRDAEKISHLLSPSEWMSRTALLNYINGLRSLIKGAETVIKAKEVPSFVDKLDRAVTSAFAQEDVSREAKLLWSEVSLGGVLQSSVAAMIKKEIVDPFTPELRLWKVEITWPPTSSGKPRRDGFLRVRITGMVKGRDVSLVKFYRDNELIYKQRVSRFDKKGRFFFQLPRLERAERHIYRLRAVGKRGELYEKIYKFSPAVFKFRWRGPPVGSFALPEEGSPVLDKVFLVKTRRLKDLLLTRAKPYVKF